MAYQVETPSDRRVTRSSTTLFAAVFLTPVPAAGARDAPPSLAFILIPSEERGLMRISPPASPQMKEKTCPPRDALGRVKV